MHYFDKSLTEQFLAFWVALVFDVCEDGPVRHSATKEEDTSVNKSNDEPLRELGSFPGGTGSDHYGVESCQCDMMRHETVGSAELAKFDKSHLAGRTLKIPVSIFIATSLLLISCGKPAPPRDFATMATLVKVGMTKEEVIQAIGKPDVNSLEDSSLKGQSSSGVFIFSYHDGLKHLIVSFANDKVVRRSNF